MKVKTVKEMKEILDKYDDNLPIYFCIYGSTEYPYYSLMCEETDITIRPVAGEYHEMHIFLTKD